MASGWLLGSQVWLRHRAFSFLSFSCRFLRSLPRLSTLNAAHSCSLPFTPACVDAWISMGEWEKRNILVILYSSRVWDWNSNYWFWFWVLESAFHDTCLTALYPADSWSLTCFRLVLIDLTELTATQLCNGQTPGGVAGNLNSCQLQYPRGMELVGGKILITSVTAGHPSIMQITGWLSAMWLPCFNHSKPRVLVILSCWNF